MKISGTSLILGISAPRFQAGLEIFLHLLQYKLSGPYVNLHHLTYESQDFISLPLGLYNGPDTP